MTGIISVLKNNMCVIALVMFYDNITKYATEVYRVLGCVLYSVIDNYVCIDYLCCQSKLIIDISRDKFFRIRVTMNCVVLEFQNC